MAATVVAPKPPSAPPSPPADPLVAYYRNVRQMNLALAKERYKQGFKVRTQEYIRGRGTLAIVDEEICMGCTHCFDNCAFEAIDMVDRKFALPEYTYTSRKAIIIEDNCVGCEKCAIVCPVDAITMVTKHGFEVKDGRVVSTTAPPPLPRPAAPAAVTPRPATPLPVANPAPSPPTPAKPAAPPEPTETPAPKVPPPKPEPEQEEADESTEESSEESEPPEEDEG